MYFPIKNNLLLHATGLFVIALSLVLSACTQKPSGENAPTTPDVDLSDLPLISFSIGEEQAADDLNSDLTVVENIGRITLTATLSEAVEHEISFEFRVNGAETTATNLNDFMIFDPTSTDGERITQGRLTFPPGETTIPLGIDIVNDRLFEPTEKINLEFANNFDQIDSAFNLPANKNNRAFLNLFINEDNQTPPVVEISSVLVSSTEKLPQTEIGLGEDESIEISLRLPGELSGEDLKVRFQLSSSITAVEGDDYEFPFAENRASDTDTFSDAIIPAEQEKVTFTLPIYDDLEVETPEILTFSLFTTENAIVNDSGITSVTFTINDNDNPNASLNDTGIENCYDESKTLIDCITHDSFPFEDGAIANPARFVKFNYVRPAPELSIPLPEGETEWECVYDQNTGLLWEIGTKRKRDDNLANIPLLNWFNDNPSTNGGLEGNERDSDGSDGTTAKVSTQAYADKLNEPVNITDPKTTLCEVANWRLPKLHELISIMDFETPPENNTYFNADFFPYRTNGAHYWTASPSAIDPNGAWCLFFGKVIKDSANICDKSDELPSIMVSTVNIVF